MKTLKNKVLNTCLNLIYFTGSKPTTESQTGGLNTAVISGAAAAGVVLIGLTILAICWKRRKRSPDGELKQLCKKDCLTKFVHIIEKFPACVKVVYSCFSSKHICTKQLST